MAILSGVLAAPNGTKIEGRLYFIHKSIPFLNSYVDIPANGVYNFYILEGEYKLYFNSISITSYINIDKTSNINGLILGHLISIME